MEALDGGSVVDPGHIELLDPRSLPAPWRSVVWYWLHHHPDRLFLPQLDGSGEYRLSWDDLRDILIAAGVLDSKLNMT